MSATRLDRWLTPRFAARVADTMRIISENPTEVAVFRRGTQVSELTVCVTPAAARTVATLRGTASQQTQFVVTVLAPPNTDFRVDDRLQAADNRAWRIVGVSPDRSYGTEATAETA